MANDASILQQTFRIHVGDADNPAEINPMERRAEILTGGGPNRAPVPDRGSRAWIEF